MTRRLAAALGALLLVAACQTGGGAASGGAAGSGAAGSGAAGSGAAGSGAAGTPTPGPIVTGPATGNLEAIKSSGKLRIGVKFDVTGFGLRNPTTNEVEGLDADIGRELAKELGVEPEFQEAVSANRIPFLEQNKVDVVISTFTINEERKQRIDFSLPYYLAGQSILVKSDSTIQSVNDLNGKTVCSVQGSTSEKNVREKAPQAQLQLFATYTEAGQALSDGRCEAVSTDDSILFGLAERIQGTELRGGTFTQEPLGIGVQKGRTDLVQFVDQTLQEMKADGRLKTLYDKHIKRFTGQDVQAPF